MSHIEFVVLWGMDKVVATSLLKQHEPEMRRLGVEHLFLFGSTGRNEARGDSDVDLFFDHERGALGLFQLMDLKALAEEILGVRADIMTRNSLHPAVAGSDRGVGGTHLLMPQRSQILRLSDIIEAIEHIGSVTAGVSLDASSPIGRSAGSSNAASRLYPRRADT